MTTAEEFATQLAAMIAAAQASGLDDDSIETELENALDLLRDE